MSANKQFRIVRTDDETLHIYLGDEFIAVADYDNHGWSGINLAEQIVKNIAHELHITVVEENG